LAKVGRARCLQLISTIYIRQGKKTHAMRMSREVITILEHESDTNGTLALAYSALGSFYETTGKADSAAIFYTLASDEFERSGISSYLPTAYLRRGQLAQKRGDRNGSFANFTKAYTISVETGNKQAQVSSLVALGNWQEAFGSDAEAENRFLAARKIAETLSDKLFEIRTLEELIALKGRQGDHASESSLQKRLLSLKDTVYSLEKVQIVKNLEVKFEVDEKDRELALASKEREISRLTNTLLFSGIILLLVLFAAAFYTMRRIRRKDQLLLKTKEELVQALEDQKKLREEQFQSDLEHKESQLSAITLQMLQKNDLLNDFRSAVESRETVSGRELSNLVNKYFTHDSYWNDFDNYFESINGHFYARVKQRYPDISANDLKICALIRLNMNVKEMASVLNISPDSVKTARYRLRKKLQLVTEDNLNSFILAL